MTTRYAHMSATAAIAVLALTSTPLLAQDAGSTATQPVAADPAPATTATPAPALDNTPVTPEAAPESTAADAGTSATDTPAAPKRSTRKRHAATVAARTAAHPVIHAAKASAPVATAAVAPTTAAPPAAPAKPQPVVDMSATEPSQPAATTASLGPTKGKGDDTALIAGGGALALLALGGGAFALARRRDEHDEVVEDEVVHDEHVDPVSESDTVVHDQVSAYEQPAVLAPSASAFAWGQSSLPDDRSDRAEGETWTERAMRGPTPDNPSLSLKKRLKRAAFFEQRDREVAAGVAKPVDADAGLPEALETDELELA
jgi:resuscitation-promoting factor RpfA